MRGVAVRDFRGWRRRFFDEAGKLLAAHYPDRTEKLFVVNAPRGISLVLGVATRFMPPWSRERIVVSSDTAPLLEYLGRERVPKEYGGDGELALGEAPEDRAFTAFVAARVPEAAAAADPTADPAADEPAGADEPDDAKRARRRPLGG